MSDAEAKQGAKNMNLGLPLTGKQLKAFADMFAEAKYFGHVKFGLKNRRIDPEDLIKNISKEKLDGTGFLLLLGYLIRNGLDVNHYITGPYNVKIHLAAYLNVLNPTTVQAKYIFDLLKSAGCSFSIPAYTGGKDTSGKSVEDAINYSRPDLKIDDNDNYSLKDFLKSNEEITIEWKDFRNILLDQKFSKEENKDVFGFLTKLPENMRFLMRTIVLYLSSVTEAINCIRESTDEDMFRNSLGNMNQATYIAINSQNIDVFKTILEKGSECNYICMTEIISRHNEAGERDDKILMKNFGDMLSYAVLTGALIDSYQLQYLSLFASVELIETIKTNYEEPEWKKACKRTVPGDKKQFPVKKLRQIAFDMNLDFNLSPSEICDKLDQISNIDRLEYAKASIERQEERVRRALIEVGDIREGDSLGRTRCNAKSMLINNPYAYNDARMAFYRDDSGELWCFTSDLFEPMIQSGRNPYSNKKLPVLFMATIKTQFEILKFLDLAHPKDSKDLSEYMKEYFENRGSINNRFSEDFYIRAVGLMRLNYDSRDTIFTEEYFRTQSINKKGDGKIFKYFSYLSFYFSVTNDYKIAKDFVKENIVTDNKNYSLKEFQNIINYENDTFKFPKDFLINELFLGAKYIKNIPQSQFNELYFRLIAENFLQFYNFFKISKEKEDKLNVLKNISEMLTAVFS
tara:strand:+ start:1436 stop:3496 length:2061 start_codon:yes stop_codon:yes gene_type:complete